MLFSSYLSHLNYKLNIVWHHNILVCLFISNEMTYTILINVMVYEPHNFFHFFLKCYHSIATKLLLFANSNSIIKCKNVCLTSGLERMIKCLCIMDYNPEQRRLCFIYLNQIYFLIIPHLTVFFENQSTFVLMKLNMYFYIVSKILKVVIICLQQFSVERLSHEN